MPRSSPTLQVVRPGTKASKPRASASTGGDGGTSTQRIVESITAAIVERRLMPGTKLAEQKIADIFKVSRTLVRQALNQLSRDKLVTLEPARGARVAEPSIEEARQVFEVRRLLETAMIRRAAVELSDAQLADLRVGDHRAQLAHQGGFEHGAHLEDLARLLHAGLGDESAARRLQRHQPVAAELVERLAHEGARHAEDVGDLLLGQLGARHQPPLDDGGGDGVDDALRRPGGARLGRAGRHAGARFLARNRGSGSGAGHGGRGGS
jgi:DNA-binding GntR family transcriptional regulator